MPLGGRLLSETALATRARSLRCELFGGEPEAGNDGQQSLRSGSPMRIDTPKTLSDGAQTQQLGQLTFSIIQRDVTDIETASDDELIVASVFLHQG